MLALSEEQKLFLRKFIGVDLKMLESVDLSGWNDIRAKVLDAIISDDVKEDSQDLICAESLYELPFAQLFTD